MHRCECVVISLSYKCQCILIPYVLIRLMKWIWIYLLCGQEVRSEPSMGARMVPANGQTTKLKSFICRLQLEILFVLEKGGGGGRASNGYCASIGTYTVVLHNVLFFFCIIFICLIDDPSNALSITLVSSSNVHFHKLHNFIVLKIWVFSTWKYYINCVVLSNNKYIIVWDTKNIVIYLDIIEMYLLWSAIIYCSPNNKKLISV